jgi:hypothetical protein
VNRWHKDAEKMDIEIGRCGLMRAVGYSVFPLELLSLDAIGMAELSTLGLSVDGTHIPFLVFWSKSRRRLFLTINLVVAASHLRKILLSLRPLVFGTYSNQVH